MSFLYKTINHEIYVLAIDIENTEYLHGGFKYRDSARRWAMANSNPLKRPLAKEASSSIADCANLILSSDNQFSTDKELKPAVTSNFPPKFLEPTQGQLEAFYLIYGDSASYTFNQQTGQLSEA